MCAVAREIAVERYTIPQLVDAVERGDFVIPTFQRDVIWRQDQIASLWDSMYRCFPIGSLIYWQTSRRLDLIREVGGASLGKERLAALGDEFRYILDGQQRLTAIYVAMKDETGRIEGDPASNYALYFDATADLIAADGVDEQAEQDDSDDDVAVETDGERDDVPDKSRYFLFKKAANRRRAALAKAGLPPELVARVADAEAISPARIATLVGRRGAPPVAIERLNQLHRLLHDYVIPVERVRGVDLAEVCDIFMRINKSGRRPESADIVIATMFREGEHGVNLRRLFADIREEVAQRQPAWRRLKSQTLLQMIGVCMREARLRDGAKDANSFGMNSRQLLELTPDAVKPHWDTIRAAIIKTISFLMEEGVYQPSVVPAIYMLMPLCAHFFVKASEGRPLPEVERRLLAQWIWRTAFDPASIADEKMVGLARSSFFAPLRAGATPALKPLNLQRARLLDNAQATSALYRATLSFLSHQGPRDLLTGSYVTIDPARREVASPSAPTIHHIYPKDFLKEAGAGTKSRHRNALMNMCLITEASNQTIGNRSPMDYFNAIAGFRQFSAILDSHLIPAEHVTRPRFEKRDYPLFLEARLKCFIEALSRALPDTTVRAG